MLRRFLASLIVAAIAVSPAMAYNLSITEIWPGNEPGNNLSEDWFEITNFGSTAWTQGTNGYLWFDDESADTGDAVLMTGISSIAPGESVVFVDENDSAAWSDLWDDVITLPQVGDYDGKGLGQGGDGVAVWIHTSGTVTPTGAHDLYATFPDADNNGGQSYDVLLGAFSTVGNAAGAVATTVVNDEGQAAIGSPGEAVPEPSTLAMLLGALAPLALIRRRRK